MKPLACVFFFAVVLTLCHAIPADVTYDKGNDADEDVVAVDIDEVEEAVKPPPPAPKKAAAAAAKSSKPIASTTAATKKAQVKGKAAATTATQEPAATDSELEVEFSNEDPASIFVTQSMNEFAAFASRFRFKHPRCNSLVKYTATNVHQVATMLYWQSGPRLRELVDMMKKAATQEAEELKCEKQLDVMLAQLYIIANSAERAVRVAIKQIELNNFEPAKGVVTHDEL